MLNPAGPESRVELILQVVVLSGLVGDVCGAIQRTPIRTNARRIDVPHRTHGLKRIQSAAIIQVIAEAVGELDADRPLLRS
jgi:hypothetical protein